MLVENSTYTLSNFHVMNNDLIFKASEHKYKLKWTGGTNVVDVNKHKIPDAPIKFKPLAEIVAGKWRADLLYRKRNKFFVVTFQFLHNITAITNTMQCF